jgi:Ca2+-binding RTX toxin-like protein
MADIYGTNAFLWWGHDYLNGTLWDDRIFGLSGQDTIYGYGGNDYIVGGDGHDLVYGGSGNDTIYGDETNGQAGWANDTLYGEAGNDIIYGGVGNDYIFGGSDQDFLYGEADNDFLYGGDGHDYLSGGSGSDFLNGQWGNDTLDGGGTYYNSGEFDTLTGGANADTFILGSWWQPYYLGNGHAIITDFNRYEDKLQLKGPLYNYYKVEGNFGVGRWATDTGIYSNGDLIAILQDVSGLNYGGSLDSSYAVTV